MKKNEIKKKSDVKKTVKDAAPKKTEEKNQDLPKVKNLTIVRQKTDVEVTERPKTKVIPVTKVNWKEFQDLLQAKRDDIIRMSKSKETDLTYGDIGDEGDIASQTFEREMMFELTNSERMILDDVEAALRKLEKGEFGVCEACRREISLPRLKAMPWARCCIDCQSRTEMPRG